MREGYAPFYSIDNKPKTHFLCVGPVGVVSIAGPYRKGKSYILSEAFDQPEVFPLGHHFDPETVGIWMWIVPQKMRVSSH